MMTKLTATYHQDSKRYHRYTIDTDEDAEIVGNIYIPKDSDIPPKVIITLRVKQVDA